MSSFDPRRDHKYTGRNDQVLSLLDQDSLTVLDVGCGCGGTAAELSAHGRLVDGITWSEEEAQSAREVCRTVIVADVSQGLPSTISGPYDAVICSHLLEHIAYPQQLLADIHRVLRPGGCLIVAIPNLFFWLDRIKLLLGHWEYQQSGTFDYTHVRWYTYKSMARLLEDHGFAPDVFVADGWIPAPLIGKVLGDKFRKRLNEFACRCCPGLFGKQLLYRSKRTIGHDIKVA